MRGLPDESEAAFQAWVIHLAKLKGWRVYHARPAQDSRGRWATHQTGDAGFPDLMLAHSVHGAIFAELKTRTGKPTPAQTAWLDTLTAAGHTALIWRPADRPHIENLLNGGK